MSAGTVTPERERVLDCGHTPSPHSPHTTGTAATLDGREVCWTCSNAEELAAFQASGSYVAYVSSDGERVETWPGGLLARVVSHRAEQRSTPTGGWFERHYYNARGIDGARWYGVGIGPGGIVRLRRMKG